LHANFPHLKALTLSNINIVDGGRGGAPPVGEGQLAVGGAALPVLAVGGAVLPVGQRGTTGRRERWPAVEGGRGKMN
jgi:hypothetical protein